MTPAIAVPKPTSASPMRAPSESVANKPPTAIIQPPTATASPRALMSSLLSVASGHGRLCRSRPVSAAHCGGAGPDGLLDGVEARQRRGHQGEPDERDRPAERQQAGRPERGPHHEREEGPTLLRCRSHLPSCRLRGDDLCPQMEPMWITSWWGFPRAPRSPRKPRNSACSVLTGASSPAHGDERDGHVGPDAPSFALSEWAW